MKRQRLRVKRIETVGFVDKGDNPPAEVVFFKRSTPKDEPMDDKTPKDTPDAQKAEAVGLLTKLAQFLGLADEDVTKATNPTGGDPVAEPKDTPQDTPAEPVAPEGVSKAEIEAMQKRLEDAEKRATEADERVAKLETERRTAEFVKRAEGYASIPVEAPKFGPILMKAADALTDEERDELYRVLDAANEAARVGKLFSEAGNDMPEGSARAQVTAKAEEIRKADPKLTLEQAKRQVYRDNPELAEQEAAEDAAAAERR